MVTLDDDQSAALVVRVWLEGGTDQFRGRLIAVGTSPGSRGGAGVTVAVASSPREVADALSEWLHAFIRDAPTRIDTE